MTISALAIAAAAVWPALDASDAAIYRSIREPRVVAVQPNHTHKEMVLMPDGEVRYYGKDLVDGRPREVYLSSRDRGPDGKVEVRTNDTASTSLNFFRPVQPLEKSRRWIFAGARRIDGYERPALAISEDDGKTWIGFREVALDPIRNRADFRSFRKVHLP